MNEKFTKLLKLILIVSFKGETYIFDLIDSIILIDVPICRSLAACSNPC